MDRNQHFFNCWGASCGEADNLTIPIGTGTYRVIVKNYSASFEELCYKEQVVAVNSLLEETPVFSRTGFTNTSKQSVVKMDVYPTIAREKIYIDISNNIGQVTNIQIWSQYGQIVQSIKVDKEHFQTPIDINYLAKGIYFLNAPLKDGSNLTRKIIIK